MNPARIMSLILIIPLENTIALGGVEMGIIKAQLAARVTGIANINPLIPKPLAIPITTGIKIVVKATLLINSVMKSITVVSNISITHNDMFGIPAILLPIS